MRISFFHLLSEKWFPSFVINDNAAIQFIYTLMTRFHPGIHFIYALMIRFHPGIKENLKERGGGGGEISHWFQQIDCFFPF